MTQQPRPASSLDDHIEMGKLFAENAHPDTDESKPRKDTATLVDFTATDFPTQENVIYLRIYFDINEDISLKFSTEYQRYNTNPFIDWLRSKNGETTALSTFRGGVSFLKE